MENNRKILIIALLFIASIGFVFLMINTPQTTVEENTKGVVDQVGDSQEINISVRGGYKPNLINAKANTKTLLKMITKNTFDCSSALIIPQLKYNKTLPPTGTTEIDIPPQKAGSVITGSCSMGMYGFKINFL